MRNFLKLLLLLIISFQTMGQVKIPNPLVQWQDWVVRDILDFKCPSSSQNYSQRKCTWPSLIEVSVNKKSGQFSGTWRTFNQNYITLPGQVGQWPINVKINGKSAIVIDLNGLPTVKVEKGLYRVSGQFAWAKPPLRLVLPSHVGLVALNVYGKKVVNPSFDSAGDLWLKGSQGKVAQKKNFLQLKVFRKLTDDIPATDETLIELSVGGAEREVELSSTLLKGFIPLSFTASVPAKWESSGKLKIRVRPGKHTVHLQSRSLTPLSNLEMPQNLSPLPQSEIWSFVARNQLRITQVQGVDQVDSQQIAMPKGFRGHPTYLMKPGKKFSIIEISRGLKGDKENEISLTRTHWLDFSGKKFTVKDQISGEIKKDWRLSMLSPFELGSVRMGSKNQLVTIDKKEGKRGVEVRNAYLNLTAESRLEKKGLKIPATGWNENFKSIRGSFNIPPGWRTLALFGADYSKGTWFSKWSLLSLFFVLVLSIGMFKLKGMKWSIITFFSLVLLIHEKNAPYWIWLHLLISLGLERAMAEREKINNFVRSYRLVCLFILVVISFPFIVEQIQKAIYPSLERQKSNSSFYSSIGKTNNLSRSYAPKLMKKSARKIKNELAAQSKGFSDNDNFGGAAYEESIEEPTALRKNQMDFDPSSTIQTGPGIPNWSWGRVTYGWEGPVKKGQSIYLVTLSPLVNRLFTFLRILLLGLLLYCFIDIKGLKQSGLLEKATKGFMSFLLLSFLVFDGIKPTYAQDFPRPELLKELKTEVLKPASCFPSCVSIEKMDLRYTKLDLMIKLRAHVAKDSYFTLPGSRDQWFPQSILVNGQKNNSLRGEGQGLSLFLPKGVHDVVLTGKLGSSSQLQIALGLKPKNIGHSGTGWSVEGIRENGKIESSLTFYRKEGKKKKGAIDLGSTLLPHFVKVERVFNMGLNWSVRTTVSRLSPIGRAINLEIQKVQGEKLTSSNVEDQGNFFKVNLSKSARSISWNSILPEVGQIKLKASSQNMISEVWRFQPGPIWRVDFSGLSNISQLEGGSTYAPLYRPWAGEEVVLNITRPKAAAGRAITLEQANLNITPGKRLTNYDLNMTFKTSMGVAHTVKLPEGSQLVSVHINGKGQSLTLKDSSLRLPLGVGSQKVQVKWEASEGISSLFKTPILDLGLKGINLKLQVKLSAKRWVIYLGGPVMGPAVLFWGKLIALLILSFFLSKISWCPLTFFHWSVLSIGLTQGFNAGIFLVAGYLIFISFRRENYLKMKKANYNLTSALSLMGAIVSISTFFSILKNGLLGGPRMGIEGNESSAFVLNWFVDRFDGTIPYAWVFSFPTIAYQLLMLLWAIWMTFSLIKWVPWLWEGIYASGFFKKIEFNMKNESRKKEVSEVNKGDKE